MKTTVILTPAIVLFLFVYQANAQVYEKLTDLRVAKIEGRLQELEGQGQSDEPFDPFAEEKKASPLGDSKNADPFQEDDLGLNKEPDMGKEMESDEDENDSPQKSEDEADNELEAEREQNKAQARNRISIDQYLRPISSLSASGATGLAPERGGIDFPQAVQPVVFLNAPRNSWAFSSVQWQKPLATHRQLYFEDVPLERCGVQAGKWRQNYISGTTFLGDAILVPVRRLQHQKFQTYQRSVDRFSDPQLMGR